MGKKLGLSEEEVHNSEMKEQIKSCVQRILSLGVPSIEDKILSNELKSKKRKQKSKNVVPKKVAVSTKNSVDPKVEKLKKLKSFVAACGVRKQWKKIFGDIGLKEQIIEVQTVLRELGVEGRPSMKKCHIVKKEKERKEEMQSVDTANILKSSRRGEKVILSEPLSVDESEDVIDFSKLGDPFA